MKKQLLGFLLVLFAYSGYSQVSLTAINTASTVDFTGFDGSGFAPTPAAGQLDSDDWAIAGLSDGDLTFGGIETAGDFARGINNGGSGQGGIYAFDVSGNIGMGFQPSGSDMTPGTFTLRLVNNTGNTVSSLDIEYDILVFNDQGRGNSFNFSYSDDDVAYTSIASADYISPLTADATPTWAVENRSFTITGLSIAPSAFFYLRWNTNDVSGGGSRDELGVDNISVTPQAAGPSAPTAITDPATNIQATSATLNATVTANGADAGVIFEIGDAPGVYNLPTINGSPVTVLANDPATAVTGSATGLTAGTTYYYRVSASNSQGTTPGTELSFTPNFPDPIVTTDPATGISATTATLNATVDDNGTNTDVIFRYGTIMGGPYNNPAPASPILVAAGSGATPVSAPLTGLANGATYYYVVEATNASGNPIQGAELSFVPSNRQTIVCQDFEGASCNWNYTPTPTPFNSNNDVWDVVTSLNSINPPTGSTNFWGIRDLENPINSGGTGNLAFDAVSVAGFANFKISLDYNVFEFDGGDDLEAELFVNGLSQGRFTIFNGVNGGNGASTTGWENWERFYSSSAQTISFVIYGVQNGGGDYAGIDNVRLEGEPSSGCFISGISIGSVSGCDNAGTPNDDSDDFYTCDLTVTFDDAPATGSLEVTSAQLVNSPLSVPVGQLTGPASHTFSGVEVRSNGQIGDALASFTDDAVCFFEVPDVLPAQSACSQTDLLIFSEYVFSGTNGNDKALEIFNPTATTLSLAGYQIRIYGDGSIIPTTTVNLDPAASIPAGGVYVVGNGSAGTGITAVANEFGSLFFNGNDAVELFNGFQATDIIGQIGSDPGTEWSNGGCSTLQQTLRKNTALGAATADTDGSNAYDPSAHFQECVTANIFSNLGITSPFPVEYLDFSAIARNEGVELSWATASELNNDHFVVQRSYDRSAFEDLGRVQGAGNSQTVQTYGFIDREPGVGTVYYRLKQVDFDGAFDLSSLVEVSLGAADRLQVVRTRPNPAFGQLTLDLQVPVAGPATLELLSLAGQQVLLRQVELPAGNQTLSLPVGNLASGLYLYRLRMSGQVVRGKWVKE